LASLKTGTVTFTYSDILNFFCTVFMIVFGLIAVYILQNMYAELAAAAALTSFSMPNKLTMTGPGSGFTSSHQPSNLGLAGSSNSCTESGASTGTSTGSATSNASATQAGASSETATSSGAVNIHPSEFPTNHPWSFDSNLLSTMANRFTQKVKEYLLHAGEDYDVNTI